MRISGLSCGSASAYAQIEIQTDSGSNTPSGTAVSSTETQDWPAYLNWETIRFSTPARLTAGSKYWIVATCSDSYQNGYAWGYNGDSVYAGGGASTRDNTVSTPTWGTESATNDCQFKAYLYYYDTIVRFYDGDPDSGGTQIDTDRSLPPIPASGAASTSVDWSAVFGSHDIYVVVDPDNSVGESTETNNKAYKSLSVGVVISFTVTDYNNDGVQFGNVDPGADNQPADQNVTQGAVTLTIGSETEVDVDVQLKGDDFGGPGTSSITVGTVKYNNSDSLVGTSTLTSSYVTWYSVSAYTSDTRQAYYWIDIPSAQTAGGYTSTFYYQAIESG